MKHPTESLPVTEIFIQHKKDPKRVKKSPSLYSDLKRSDISK